MIIRKYFLTIVQWTGKLERNEQISKYIIDQNWTKNIRNLNISVTSNETEVVISKNIHLTKDGVGLDGFTVEYY